MTHEQDKRHDPSAHPPADQRGTDAGDRIRSAQSHLLGGAPQDGGAYGAPAPSRQETLLREWAESLGLLLSPDDLPAKVIKGGQEHDVYLDETTQRVFKLTRHGVFGFSPGIELALVSSADDARRFHLWEATPLQYLERLRLQNILVPGINRLEGIIDQHGQDLVIVTSQPYFEPIHATTAEIDTWFAALGFEKVTDSAYYRREDNLGVFDAHDKNLVHAAETLVPFDVIPCQPDGGFLDFIQETLAAGHSVHAIRSTHTGTRS